jgi:hypothetical protein
VSLAVSFPGCRVFCGVVAPFGGWVTGFSVGVVFRCFSWVFSWAFSVLPPLSSPLPLVPFVYFQCVKDCAFDIFY